MGVGKRNKSRIMERDRQRENKRVMREEIKTALNLIDKKCHMIIFNKKNVNP